jgi:type II secretory pathway pseudopilin PulG
MSRLRAALGRRPEDRDGGMSLVELIVAMGIFTVVVSVFMAGIVVMTKSTARAQAVGDAGDSARKVFQKLDKEVRYAAAINGAGPGSAGTYYVEYLTTAVDAGLKPLCTQWRYVASSRQLQVRTWRTDAPTPTAWRTMATNVRNDLTTNKPFVTTFAGTVALKQRLTVRLDIGPGAAGGKKGAELEADFVARNSSIDSQSNRDDDLNGTSDLPVCPGPGRP